MYQQDQAIKAFRRFHFLDPDTPWVLLHLATAYDELNLADEALRYYDLYLESGQDGILRDIARVRLYLVRGEHEQVKRVFEEIMEKFTGRDRWIDVVLSGFDLHQGNPALVIERVENFYPELVPADPEIVTDPEWFALTMV